MSSSSIHVAADDRMSLFFKFERKYSIVCIHITFLFLCVYVFFEKQGYTVTGGGGEKIFHPPVCSPNGYGSYGSYGCARLKAEA